MNSVPSVMLYGRDRDLLELRRLVLQQAGIHAWTASTFEEVRKLINAHIPALLVLCYSLAGEECEQIVAMIHDRKLAVRVLAFEVGAPVRGLRPVDEVFGFLDGPEALVAAVERQLRQIPPTPGALS